MKGPPQKLVLAFMAVLLAALSAVAGFELSSFHIQRQVAARAGQLDLRTLAFAEGDIIPLTGEWTFYAHRLLTPQDLAAAPGGASTLQVPQVWGQGYGTYQLDVRLSAAESRVLDAILVPSISSAYRLWVNGRLVHAAGTVGTSRGASVAQDKPGIVAFHSGGATRLDIVIDVSNFVQQKGGIGEKLLLGNLQSLLRFHDTHLFIELFIVGALGMMGLYYGSFYLARRRERFALYFALLCWDVAAQAFLLDSSNLTALVPRFGWILEAKAQYLSESLGVMLLILVTKALYPADSRPLLNRAFVALGGAFCGVFLLTPPWIFTEFLPSVSLLVTLALCYILYVFMRAIRMQRDYAIVNLVSLSFFAASIVNDILYYLNVIQTGNLVPEGLFMFVLLQAITFSHRHALTLGDLEHNTHRLSSVNDQLEARIQERTQALADALAELRQTNASLERLSTHDSLTTIPNRRYFETALADMWNDLAPKRRPLTILFIDIDFFKQYNDTCGHIQGDTCLRDVALALQTHLNSYPGAFVARFGGEEFAAVIPDVEFTAIADIAESIRQLVIHLQIPHTSSEVHPFVTASVGAVTVRAHASVQISDLILKADDALYQAKRGGRNQTVTLRWEDSADSTAAAGTVV